jgi:hypothetical protein
MYTPLPSRILTLGSLMLLALLAVTSTGTAHAQAQVPVNIPFAFESGGRLLQPGVYRIAVPAGGGVMMVRGDKDASFTMSLRDESDKPAAASKVVFKHYGNQYFLREVWVAGSTSHLHTLKSHHEKEAQLAQATTTHTNDTLALLAMPH